MEESIHRENLALLRKRLAEVENEPAREMILTLQAKEEAKGKTPSGARSWETAPEDQMTLRQVNAPGNGSAILYRWQILFFGVRRLP